MKKYFISVITIILLDFGISDAQNSYYKGLVITNDRDTISGNILYKSNKEMFSTCHFIPENTDSLKVFKPDEITGYKVGNTRYFISKKIQDKYYFLEWFFDGVINFYYKNDKTKEEFYLEDENNTFVRLSNETKVTWVNDEKYESLPKYMYQLKEAFQQNEEMVTDIEKIKKLNKTDLADLAMKYQFIKMRSDDYLKYENRSDSEQNDYIDKIDNFSPDDFKEGYIITNSGDTVFGEVLLTNALKSTNECSFKKNSNDEVRKYFPSGIKGYRYTDGKFFVSKQDPNTDSVSLIFFEFLIKGKVNAYYKKDKFGDHYYIETENGEFAELTDQKEIVNIGLQLYLKPEFYKGKLSYALSDSKNIKEAINETELNHKSLISLLEKYHNDVCDSYDCIVYEKNIKHVKYKFSFEAGAVISKLNFGGKVVSKYTPSPAIGIYLSSYHLLVDNDHVFFKIGAGLMKSSNVIFTLDKRNELRELFIVDEKKYYLNRTEDVEIIDQLNYVTKFRTDLDAVILKIPLSINYIINPDSKNQVYLGAGLNTEFFLTQNKDFNYVFFKDEFGKSIPSPLFGFNIELGYEHVFLNKSALNVHISYGQTQNMNNINQFLRMSLKEIDCKIAYIF